MPTAITQYDWQVSHLRQQLSEALACLTFIGKGETGQPKEAHRACCQQLEKTLIALEQALSRFDSKLERFKQQPTNSVLWQALPRDWRTLCRTQNQALTKLTGTINSLQPPLSEDDVALWQDILAALRSALQHDSLHSAALTHKRHTLQRAWLEESLLSLNQAGVWGDNPPSCFISYAWGDAGQVRRVHRIATLLKDYAGIAVKLDIWDNTTGNIAAFVSLIHQTDTVLLMGSPGVKEKWDNYSFPGASRGGAVGTSASDDSQPHQGHVLAQELAQIANRLRRLANASHGIILAQVAGSFEACFAGTPVDGLPVNDRIFSMLPISANALFDLLKTLVAGTLIEQSARRKQLDSTYQALQIRYQQLISAEDAQLDAWFTGITPSNSTTYISGGEPAHDLNCSRPLTNQDGNTSDASLSNLLCEYINYCSSAVASGDYSFELYLRSRDFYREGMRIAEHQRVNFCLLLSTAACIKNAVLASMYFTNAVFSTIELENVKFDKAKCQGAQFIQSTLAKVSFREANLKRTNFSGASFNEVCFFAAKVEGMNISNSTGLTGRKLSEAIYETIVVNEDTKNNRGLVEDAMHIKQLERQVRAQDREKRKSLLGFIKRFKMR